MSPPFKLTTEERLTLQQLAVNHRHRDIRTRAMGLLRLSGLNRPADVAAELGISQTSVYSWARSWRERGLCGLLGGHAGGRPRALSDAMISTAIKAASEESMTLAKIAKQVEAHHDKPLPCTLQTLSTALKAAGLSYKRARYSLKKNGTKKRSP